MKKLFLNMFLKFFEKPHRMGLKSLKAPSLLAVPNFLVVIGLFALSLSATPPAHAQTIDDIYTIADIKVDVTERTASRAKVFAFSQAENRAFKILMNKMLPSESLELVVLPEGQSVSNYIAGIDVVAERNSKTRYLATLNVSFNPTSVRQLFGELGLAFSEISAPPTLLLPIYDRSGSAVIWGNENKTMKAFVDFVDKNSLIQFTLPQGNFRERFQMQAEDLVLGRNRDRLDEFKKSYNVQRIIILVVSETIVNGVPSLHYQWHFEKDENEKMLGVIRGQYFEGRPGVINPTSLWPTLVQTLTKDMAREWMDKTKAHLGEFQTLQLSIRVLNINDWVTIRDKLNAVPVIQEVALDELGLPNSLVNIRHIGGLEQLRQGLLKVGLDLKEDIDKFDGWSLLSVN